MHLKQQQAFVAAMADAREAYQERRWDEAFASLERAHILGQQRTLAHIASHWWMLKTGWRRGDWHEVRGQLLRLPAALLFSRLWVPAGNSGGSNVSAFRPMPVPEGLAAIMEGMPSRPPANKTGGQ